MSRPMTLVEQFEREAGFWKGRVMSLRGVRAHPGSAAARRVAKELKQAEIAAGLWIGRLMEAGRV